ncbi:MAG TPA: glycine zipper 2TM domain-containing protein [Usitatibacter sp.]|jgi:uncharacterized protein YcfJ|nr:glycine zipper 2TM domain-containing protein [Usitatibacter sp.]
MKTLVLAVASAFAAAAPFAQAQYDRDRPYNPDPSPYVAPDRGDYRYDRRDDDRDRRDRRDERAQVIDSRPVYGEAGTHQECWNEQTNSYERHHVGAGTVIGAIAGGVLGHQVGSGRGNTAATAAGAIGGGLIGNRIDRNRADNADERERCRTVRDGSSSERDVVGYDVRYRYQGRDYETYLDHDPGRTLVVGQDTRADGTPLRTMDEYPGRPDYDPDRH